MVQDNRLNVTAMQAAAYGGQLVGSFQLEVDTATSTKGTADDLHQCAAYVSISPFVSHLAFLPPKVAPPASPPPPSLPPALAAGRKLLLLENSDGSLPLIFAAGQVTSDGTPVTALH